MICEVKVDGGWGWIIVSGFALSTMVMSGITRSFGIFFTALLEEFHGSASLTSFASGLRLCMYTIVSPFSVYLANRFSDRLVVMTGGAILCLSFALIFPAPNLAYVVIFVGVNGIGSALVSPCFQVVIGKYFRKRISVATAFGFCGASVGQMTLPYLILYLLREYGLRGMMLVYGGILFQVTIFGALIRTFPKVTEVPRKSSQDFAPLIQAKNLELKSNGSNGEWCVTSGSQLGIAPDNKELHGSKSNEDSACSIKRPSIVSISSSIVTPIPDLDIDSYITESGSEVKTGHKTKANTKAIFGKIFDTSLIKDTRFILYEIARTFAGAGFVAQMTYLIPWSIENGHSMDSAVLLLSISGGTEILGRITMGFLADCTPIGPVKLMITYTFIIGTANLFVAFVSVYAGAMAYAVAYGIWGSGGHLLTAPIISVLFDRSKISSGVGLSFLIAGVPVAGAIAIMGAIKDATGSYQGIFFTCAAFQYLASVLMAITVYLDKRKHRMATDGQYHDVITATEIQKSVVTNE